MENAPARVSAYHPGEVLRALRTDRLWTLAELSKHTGLTISTLSKVETGRMALNYDKMMRVATGLNIDIGILFAAPVPQHQAPEKPVLPQIGGRRSVTRAGEGRMIETRNLVQHYPAADLLNKQIVPIVTEVKARSRAEFGDLLRHPGEEYVLVLEGTLELHSELYAPVQLAPGDSIYFDSRMAHGYVAAGEGVCRILMVCSTVDWGANTASEEDQDRGSVQLQVVRAG
ncbi:helix-turn-helix domain-containing protein [Sphingorhabdus sp.]|jgi:transcriptional regulator with XRE-family HTH domain|uniref:helix-turn-helix domain-containing protein n=1 Tax=Sphingorhabdus sp. TaxID=1902408 RepID=UPI0037CB0F46